MDRNTMIAIATEARNNYADNGLENDPRVIKALCDLVAAALAA